MTTNHTDITEARDKLRALQAEKAECDAAIARANEAITRLRELTGDYWTPGEIECARRAVRDLQAVPVLRDSEYERERIIAVTDKWITTRIDGHRSETTTDYRKTDGLKRGSRSDNKWAERIDVEEALRLWEEWQNARGEEDSDV